MFDEHLKCVQRLLTKDSASWEYVMRRYVPFMKSMALQTGMRQGEVEETVQSTLASLWEDDAKILRDYEGRASFKTYLARVVHRDCLDFLRKKNRRRRKVERQFDAYIVSGPKGVEEQVGRKLDIEMLLDQLGPKEKALAKLIYYEGLSSEEVAVIFSTKPTTVDVWHFRLREKLRKIAGVGDSRQSGELGDQGGDYK